mgnify:CR=1 FL=1
MKQPDPVTFTPETLDEITPLYDAAVATGRVAAADRIGAHRARCAYIGARGSASSSAAMAVTVSCACARRGGRSLKDIDVAAYVRVAEIGRAHV